MRWSATAMSDVSVSPAQIGALIALVDQERLTEAEYQTRLLLAAHPNTGMLWKILGVALLRQDKGALQALRRTAELLPHDAEAHGNLGSVLASHGQWAGAVESWRRVLAIQPRDAAALVGVADAMKALGRPRDALPFYQRALEARPDLAHVHNNLGGALLALQRFEDAVASYRRALALLPMDPQVHCNLGNALRQSGALDEAMSCSRRALELAPGLSVAHNNLGLVLLTLKKRDAAVTSFRQAVSADPNSVDALNNLGNVLRETGLRREALALYRRAVAVDPSSAESHCNLGNVLFELRRVAAAVSSFETALTLRPTYVAARLSLATALRQQRRTAEAEENCHAVLAIDPAYVEALALLGELSADRGRFVEAEALFRQAFAADPAFAPALVGLAAHRKMTDGDAAWLQHAQGLLATELPLAHEISLRYALGKYCDDVRDYAAAFAHYSSANELAKRHGASYDRANLTRRVDEIIGRCDEALFRRCAIRASAAETPVFVIGMPRSGTSLAEQIMASHPAVYGAGEMTFWDQAFAHAADENALPDIAWNYLDRLTAPAGGALRVIDKMPANFLYAGLIHAAFPRARIIHMRRHPIDTCLSIYFQNFFNMGPYANDLDDLAHYYGEYVRVTDHWRAVLPPSILLEVPYEALTLEPETWTRRMLDFIGLPWDPQCLNFHQTDRVVITASKWQVRQPIHAGSAGRWKNYEKFLGPLGSL